ncbi:RNA-directed DNA polymerase from mobile element jockey [Trichonephila clavipes]|nr:RNA-directed DNA polymerase from mobile element jockey [Trichonephila clavipes]
MLPKPNQDHKFSQNYRPISLLNRFAKIFERIILNRIKTHCKAIHCIPPEQCGFQEDHSTLHQLIRVTNIINEGFASKLYTVGVFLDVKRAIDKMWHDGLTYKMITLKFPAYLIKIIYNYLHDRTFRVRVNNTFSETGFCRSGTPQGSVLSPYLYNIFTYDFPDHHNVSTCLFADDSVALTQGVHLKYTIKTMQHFLVKLEKWLTDWRIAIYVEKTQAIVFRKWGVIDPQTELTLFDDDIQWVPVVRYLGLYIDSRLTYKNHIDYLSDKFWGRIALAISLIGRSSPLSLENKVVLYKQILRPTITKGDHARLSSTTGPTIMSDFSENMEVSPTRQAQVAACEKLSYTVTGISALHLSLQDERSPSPQNSFTELYRMSTQAMIKRKEEMASKEFTEEFIFPKKTARPVSPTSSQAPIVTSNNFSDLEQDAEHPLPTTNQVTAEVVTPKIKLPHPIMLKIKKNFREQIKRINEKFPKIRNRTVNDVVKMFTNDHEEYRNLIHFLESDKDFEFYIIKRNIDKPIKAVIKGLPNSSKIEQKI